jgi:hypothetical protein
MELPYRTESLYLSRIEGTLWHFCRRALHRVSPGAAFYAQQEAQLLACRSRSLYLRGHPRKLKIRLLRNRKLKPPHRLACSDE